MIIQGKVTKVHSDGSIEVVPEKSGSCGECRSCFDGGSCDDGVVITPDRLLSVGENVKLEINNKYFFTAFWLVLIFPLVLFIATLALFNYWGVSQLVALVLGLVVFVGSYQFAGHYDKKVMKKSLYKLLK